MFRFANLFSIIAIVYVLIKYPSKYYLEAFNAKLLDVVVNKGYFQY